MNILGVECNNSGATPAICNRLGNAHQESTQGHWETAGEPGTLEETTTSAVDGQLETVSGVDESRITL